ncbi:transcription factor S-II, central domain-containing protein, partial [Hyaloraphidium curvatum]
AFAATLETHMYIALRDHSFQPGEKYKAQYRSLRLNLKDASNVTLRSRILSGELLPETLATLTSEQMASEEAMKLAEEIRQQSLKEVVLKAESERTIFRKTHKGEEEVVTTCAEPVASAPAAGRKADKSVTPSGRGDPTGDFERELPRRASIATGAVPTSDRQAQHSLDDLLAQMDDRRGSFSGTPEEGTPEDVGTRRLDSPPLEAQDDGSRSPFADQALDTGPPADPVIWKGTLQMPSVASFKCQARQIAGRRLMDAADGHDHVLANLQWDDVLRDPLQIDGRVGPDKVIDYLVQQTYSTTKEVVVIQFETEDGDGAGAFTEGDKSEYKILFEYFQTRSRYGVFGPGSRKPVAKDMYLVPVRAEDSLPDFMEFVSGSSVKDGVARKRDLLFGVAVLLKQK